jgi:3-methyladenine DNA glycosylase AlkD
MMNRVSAKANNMQDTLREIISDLRKLGNPQKVAGMARFGINTETAFGIKLPVLRAYGKKYKRNHSLAMELWDTSFHEARLLAVFIADPKQVTSALMERWLKDFNSWDICDQACMGLFDEHPLASP